MSKSAKQIALALMNAGSEDEIIQLLRDEGYWEDPSVWRYLNDDESNYAIAGNQQSRPEAALVEKLVNAVDATLINECCLADVDPESKDAPRSIREAVARFIEKAPNPESPSTGRVKHWPEGERTKRARLITLAASGKTPQQGNPNFSIADVGEGQAPGDFPDTLMSLQRGNKMKIHFVQGKWNMGGTGALRFCGKNGIQVVVSRRNPALAGAGESDKDWGFTVVRREKATGDQRYSSYTYLAPLNSKERPRHGDVLHFAADQFPILPEGREPHARMATHGTLIKLVEYDAPGFRSNIIRTDPGLLRRLDFLLPEVALPIRLYECRKEYRGHAGSFETNVAGIGVRLEDNKAENLEPGFPTSGQISVRNEQMDVTIFAFKKDVATRYRMNEGVAFVVNGQTHGALPAVFFTRKRIGLSYISDSLLLTVDCSNMNVGTREDLFMNSRDRLQEIERELEVPLREHKGLSQLTNRRREEVLREQLGDSKPLEDALEQILKGNPTLSKLFFGDGKFPNPFKKTTVTVEEDVPFLGKPFPTFFRFKGKEQGHRLVRECHINLRARVAFETDAANDYFSRDMDQGQFTLTLKRGESWVPAPANTLNLSNGIASLNCTLPADVQVGDVLVFRASAVDPSMIDPFVNEFELHVKDEAVVKPGDPTTKKNPTQKKGKEREVEASVGLPNIVPVHEAEWSKHGFDELSALKVKHAGSAKKAGSPDLYDFFVNVDNRYLKTDQKVSPSSSPVLEAQFTYGLVLLGLALLQNEKAITQAWTGNSAGGSELNIEDIILHVSRALSAVLLGTIRSLGALGEGN
jgi:hypothetical protein